MLKADGIHDLVDLPRCPDGPEVIIFVRSGHTEEGDDRITNILFDEALISVDDLGNFTEDAG
jgi:hypothetical protein